MNRLRTISCANARHRLRLNPVLSRTNLSVYYIFHLYQFQVLVLLKCNRINSEVTRVVVGGWSVVGPGREYVPLSSKTRR